MPDTLIVHDFFDIRGGGERLVLEMANGLNAAGAENTLMTGWRSEASFDAAQFPRKIIEIGYPKYLQLRGLRTILLSWHFTRFTSQVARYPVRIFSGICAIFSAPKKQPGARNIFYCHTPPRFLYDQYRFHIDRLPLKKRLLFVPVLAVYRFFYERYVARMDVIVANSVNIQRRIKTYLGRESVVVYPPCDTDHFTWLGQGDYYLSTARHAPLKRVEVIAEAFRRMPDKKLIIASSGEDAEKVKRAAAGAPNIHFSGWTNEAEMLRLMGNAIATVYIPIEEDFGMSPVESMSAGKPVIGVAEGGMLETVIDGKTGYLVPEGAAVQDVMNAVQKLTPEAALAMRSACEARAAEFSTARFIDGMRAVLASA